MRILLLSAYHVPSHAYWASGLQNQLDEYDWTCLTLQPNYFSYRIRTNAITFAEKYHDSLSSDYDVVLATSLTDIVGLKAFYPHLASKRWILYCHENQFVYPKREKLSKQVQPFLQEQVSFLLNLLAADNVVFNSQYNLDTSLAGIEKLNRQLPERWSSKTLARLRHKSSVIPVPIVERAGTAEIFAEEPFETTLKPRPNVIWNHRWEYDKGPEFLFDFLKKSSEKNISFNIAIVGQQFRQHPAAFADIAEQFGLDGDRVSQRQNVESTVRVTHFGFVEKREEYFHLLEEGDIVLSTSLHEFQGISVLEAISCGCMPLVPDTLVYPEYTPKAYRYSWNTDVALVSENIIKGFHSLTAELTDAEYKLKATKNLTSIASRYVWQTLKSQYQALLLGGGYI